MDACSTTQPPRTLVAMDIAKQHHEVLIEEPDGTRQQWRMANTRGDYDQLRRRLEAGKASVLIGFEATGVYHRPLGHFLHQCGFELRLLSSLAMARTRTALYNSWDKNDPKGAQVFLHLCSKPGSLSIITIRWSMPSMISRSEPRLIFISPNERFAFSIAS